MNQNQNPISDGQTDVDIALLRFGAVNVWKGEQEGVIEDRFAFIEGYFVFPDVLSCFDFIPFKCQFHSTLPDVIFLVISMHNNVAFTDGDQPSGGKHC
jgi:hypothetical protein